MLDQRQRRWDDVVQMVYKSFVFAGLSLHDSNHNRNTQITIVHLSAAIFVHVMVSSCVAIQRDRTQQFSNDL